MVLLVIALSLSLSLALALALALAQALDPSISPSSSPPRDPYDAVDVDAVVRRKLDINVVLVAGQGVQSEWFCIRAGVRQGCPLSPLLFNIVMDFLARQVIEACAAKGMHGFKVAFRSAARS